MGFFPQVVKSVFETNESYSFKLVEAQQLLKEAQDEIEVLNRDNKNSTSKPKCYALIGRIDNYLEESEVLEMVRDQLKTATGELLEQEEGTGQLAALNRLQTEQIQILSPSMPPAGNAHCLPSSPLPLF